MDRSRATVQVTATAFAALFSVVGSRCTGCRCTNDFMVREFGWSRAMVTSGNAISKLVVGPLFGFGAGWIVDRFGPRRADDGRHRPWPAAPHRPRRDLGCLDVLLLLLLQRARLRVWRAAAVPGAGLAMVRPDARKVMGSRTWACVGGAIVPLLSRMADARVGWRSVAAGARRA